MERFRHIIRLYRWNIAALFLAVGVLCAATVLRACEVPKERQGDLLTIVNLTNQFRLREGLRTLTYEPRLASAAQAHACDMAVTGNFSHTGSGGTQVSDRVTRELYLWQFVAENLAFGQTTAEQAVEGWKNSPGHRKNLVAPAAQEIGVGIAANSEGRIYWVQVFGAHKSPFVIKEEAGF